MIMITHSYLVIIRIKIYSFFLFLIIIHLYMPLFYSATQLLHLRPHLEKIQNFTMFSKKHDLRQRTKRNMGIKCWCDMLESSNFDCLSSIHSPSTPILIPKSSILHPPTPNILYPTSIIHRLFCFLPPHKKVQDI